MRATVPPSTARTTRGVPEWRRRRGRPDARAAARPSVLPQAIFAAQPFTFGCCMTGRRPLAAGLHALASDIGNARPSLSPPPTRFDRHTARSRVYLRALRDIRPGEEVGRASQHALRRAAPRRALLRHGRPSPSCARLCNPCFACGQGASGLALPARPRFMRCLIGGHVPAGTRYGFKYMCAHTVRVGVHASNARTRVCMHSYRCL
jgi:hypothetical protein